MERVAWGGGSSGSGGSGGSSSSGGSGGGGGSGMAPPPSREPRGHRRGSGGAWCVGIGWCCASRRRVLVCLLCSIGVLSIALLATQQAVQQLRRRTPPRLSGTSVGSGGRVLRVCVADAPGCREEEEDGGYARGAPVLAARSTGSLLEAITDAAAHALPSLRLVVVDGALPGGGMELAAALAAATPPLRTALVLPGMPAGDSAALAAAVAAVDGGVVAGLGFTDRRAAAALGVLSRVTPAVLSRSPVQPSHIGVEKYSLDDGAVHVGILGSSSGLLTQLAAACPLQRVVVHLFATHAVPPYVRRCRASVVSHGPTSSAALARAIPHLDLSMHMSSTGSAPHTVLASLAAGVPCLVPPGAAVYDADELLQRHLVVADGSDVAALRAALERSIGARTALAYGSKGLAHWQYRMARHEWAAFTATALREDPPPAPVYAPWVITPPPDGAQPQGVDAATAAAQPAALPRVAFFTAELAPATAGGAGVVIGALIEELLARSHPVVLLGHFGAAKLEAWCANASASMDARTSGGARSRLTCFDLPTVLADAGVAVPTAGWDTFTAAALEVAAALREVFRLSPFDILELYDFGGVGYELLRARTSGSDATAAATYLPATVRIAVRLHGSLELIDAAEGAADTAAARRMHYLEQVALEGADWLLALTDAMRTHYAHAYNMNPGRMLVAPPPMARVLAPVMAGPLDVILPDEVAGAVYAAAGACPITAGCRIVLVPGKLQDNKGTHTVAAALAEVWAPAAGPLANVHMVFLGADLSCPAHGTAMSACIARGAGAAAVHTTVLPPLPRAAYRWLVAVLSPVAAIVASKFETFNLASRELLALRVPAIVSNIPAFDDIAPNLAERFTRGDAHSLAAAIVAARHRWDAGLAGDGMEYGDALAPYATMARAAPPPVQPLPMLHAALDAIDPSLS